MLLMILRIQMLFVLQMILGIELIMRVGDRVNYESTDTEYKINVNFEVVTSESESNITINCM